MALVTTALNSLINAGNDAQGRFYRIYFSGGILPDDTRNLTIRTSGFTPNLPTQESYTVSYVTAKIDRPKTKVNLTRNFTLEFRADDCWYTYKELLAVHGAVMNASRSYVNTSLDVLEPYFFNVRVNLINNLSVDDESEEERLFNYNKCWISTITSPDFSNSDASPIKVTATINFLEMEDWQSGLTYNEANATTRNTMNAYEGATYA